MEGDSPPAEVASFLSGLAEAHLPTVALALSLLVGMIVGTKLRPTWPVPMIGMLAATAVVAAFSLDAARSAAGRVVRERSARAGPARACPHTTSPRCCSRPSGSRSSATRTTCSPAVPSPPGTGRPSQGTAELVALGAANLAAGVLRGFPVSSSGSRTAIGDAQGSRTQLHSLVAVVLVVVVLIAGGALLSRFPRAALGAVVIYAALRLVDIAGFRRIARFRRSEAAIAVVTMVAVLTVGVLYGVLVAVGLSVLDLLRRLARPHDGVLGYVPGVAGMHDIDDYPDAEPVPGLLVYRYDAPLCFANAENFRRRALAALDDPAGAAAVVPAQRRGERRDRQHRRRDARGAARRAAAARDRARAGPGQAGPARGPAGGRAARPHRRGADLPDPAHGRGGVPVGAVTARGAVPSEGTALNGLQHRCNGVLPLLGDVAFVTAPPRGGADEEAHRS